MAERNKTQKRPAEAARGTYGALPHNVMDSVAYTGASMPAKALLNEAIRQHSGNNNGRLQLSYSWLKKRGWKSRDVIQRAKAELLERKLIIKTRQGGLNLGPSWYAVTWLQITNFVGLDIEAKDYHPGSWCLMDKLPMGKIASAVTAEGTVNTGKRYSAIPPEGTAMAMTVP